jgi:hypothetical protein
MGMFSDIFGLIRAICEDLGNLLDPYPKKKRGLRYVSDDQEDLSWDHKSYEPWDFLSEEDWEAILRGDKSLDDFTTSHVWPPKKNNDENQDKNNPQDTDEPNKNENSEEEVQKTSECDLAQNDVSKDLTESPNEFESNAFEADFDSDYGEEGFGSSYDGYIG